MKKTQKEDDRTKLILHFNVEKTIVVRTPKEYCNVDYYLRTILCSQIWGIEEVKEDKEVIFKRTHNELEFDKSLVPDYIENNESKEIISYLEFINRKFPLKQVDPDNFETDNAYNEDQMTKKIKMIIDCRDKNQPGFPFNKQLEDMRKKIRVDEKIVQELGLESEPKNIDYKFLVDKLDDLKFDYNSENADLHNYRVLFRYAYHSTVLSFFNLIINLTKIKRRFAIIFHFFDMTLSSIQEFIFEFNSFCSGKHPKFNGTNAPQQFFDGENGKNTKDLRFREDETTKKIENVGIFVRNPKNKDKENLIWETLVLPGEVDDDLRGNIEELYDEGKEEDNTLPKISLGLNEISTAIYEKLSEYTVLGLVDDSSIFKKTHKHGKLITIDPYDYETQHIIFDTDLDKYPDKIDLIDIANCERMSLAKCINKYVVNVDPKKAITDMNYFFSKIEVCETNRQNEIKALTLKEFPYVPNNENFNLQKAIQNLSCDTYLEMTIFPLLQRVIFFNIRDLFI